MQEGSQLRDPQATTVTVVIVNTDPVERARLAALALNAGHRVIEVGDGAAALARLTPPPHTVMVVDHAINDMSATQLISAMHARGVYLPTVVTVSPFAIVDAVDAIRTGARDVLETPLGEQRFLRSISDALK
jgi:DNA-binding NtrC family response regulator